MKYLILFVLSYILVIVFTPIVFILNILRLKYRKQNLTDYFEICATGFDQSGGSIIYQQENFTISSYTYFLYKYKNNKYAYYFLKAIELFFGKGHCEDSYNWEKKYDKKELERFSNVCNS